MFSSKATIKYFNDYCVAIIDNSIVSYYCSLIPKYIQFQKQATQPHITVVRKDKETGWNKDLWKFKDNTTIQFQYNGPINYNSPYFFLDCWSDDIGDIRTKLGLQTFRQPFKSYHITLGNTK